MDRGEQLELARQAHDDLLALGDLSVRFAGVERATYYLYGRAENDSEHTFHLAISATELAATYHPELDAGLVAQFSLVHDLPEVYAGDTPSYMLDAAGREAKERAEAEALARLLTELPPHTAQLLQRYEEQVEPEARFVRFIDKLLPAIIHSVATDTNREPFFTQFGITKLADLEASSAKNTEKVRAMFPEFDFVQILRQMTSTTARARLFPTPLI